MLLPIEKIKEIIQETNKPITGILHIGSHDCEEILCYINDFQIHPNNIIWIDAIEDKVQRSKIMNIPNVFCHVITDKDDEPTVFHKSNNIQSSSILAMKKHMDYYPDIFYIEDIFMSSITIDTFFQRHPEFKTNKYNFWNLDIQGAELLALQGSKDSLKNVDYIYIEVNVDELYKDCCQIQQLENFLFLFGFTRKLLYLTNMNWGDALYVKTNV